MQHPASVSIQSARPPFGAAEVTIADMGAYLARIRPQSAAEALRLLRSAYPDATLTQRVTAFDSMPR